MFSDRKVPAGRPGTASAASSAFASSAGPKPQRRACANQRSGAREGSARSEAGEPLVAGDPPGGELDDRLEHGGQGVGRVEHTLHLGALLGA